jgi:hypothetical protein
MTTEALLGSIRAARSVPGGRLILQCGPACFRWLNDQDSGVAGSSVVPPPPVPTGQGVSYRQIEVQIVSALPAGGWRMLDDGEQVAAGNVLAPAAEDVLLPDGGPPPGGYPGPFHLDGDNLVGPWRYMGGRHG